MEPLEILDHLFVQWIQLKTVVVLVGLLIGLCMSCTLFLEIYENSIFEIQHTRSIGIMLRFMRFYYSLYLIIYITIDAFDLSDNLCLDVVACSFELYGICYMSGQFQCTFVVWETIKRSFCYIRLAAIGFWVAWRLMFDFHSIFFQILLLYNYYWKHLRWTHKSSRGNRIRGENSVHWVRISNFTWLYPMPEEFNVWIQTYT